MGNKLTYTTSCFMECTTATSSTTGGTIYDILSSSSSNRRVYGINVVNADNAANQVKLYLNDGIGTYQVGKINVTANSGNSTTNALTDLFNSTNIECVFTKTRDANGIPYLNLPTGWKIQMSFDLTIVSGTEFITTFVYGENY